jgi:hypothetical protein
MHKSVTKCNETLGKWCKNKHGASKIIDTFETYHARCLVAWEQVCRSKLEGGLGIRCLPTQNLYLQVKLLHRLHASPGSPWASWVWWSIDGPVAPGQRGVVGPHWEKLVALMPLYRALSTVHLGDGEKVSFWRDV